MNNENKPIENRQAIIIGINKYESDPIIPRLAGAENDAIELCDRFRNYGSFEISDNHNLRGSDATRKNILKAVSQVFRQDTKCELVTFYFSGHGIVDEITNEGYIAPYDMDPEDPFVSGINMEDLKKVIYSSKNKASVIIILDCCYAGIATKDTKKYDTRSVSLENEYSKNIYADNLYKIISSSDKENPEIPSETSGQGKIILASSEPTAVSREKHDCKHINSDTGPHSHGAFSFHLLEGLDGKAADPDTGIITIDNLKKYIENQMLAEQKQKPIYWIAEASNIENIKIAVSQQKFSAKILDLINAAKDSIAIKPPTTNFADIQNLDNAVKKINELMNLEPKNKEILTLQQMIDGALNMYKDPAIEWLDNNMMVARLKINEIKPGLYDYELPNLFDSLSFNELSKTDSAKLRVLIHLSSEITRNTRFESQDDRKLKILISKLRSAFATPTRGVNPLPVGS